MSWSWRPSPSQPRQGSIAEEVARGLTDIAEVACAADAAEACALVAAHPERVVPLVLMTVSAESTDTRIATLDEQAVLRRASVLLLTDRALHDAICPWRSTATGCMP